MQMQSVSSGQIESIGHDAASNTMAVQFKSGAVYNYENVSPDQYQSFLGADSIGKHFGANFAKNEDHPYTKQEV